MQRTECGWLGHISDLAYEYLFRRNTLLEHNCIRVTVSTVGGYVNPEYYYETLAFYSDTVSMAKKVLLTRTQSLPKKNLDFSANDMHETAVAEIIGRLETGEITNAYQETKTTDKESSGGPNIW